MTPDTQDIVTLQTVLSPERCAKIISEFNDYVAEGREHNLLRSGTEIRVFGYENHSEEVKALCAKLIADIPEDIGKFELDTCLAIKNEPINDPEGDYFGWHLDTFMSQHKIFCYLTDVTTMSGPTEIFVGTSSWKQKIKGVLGGHYFSLADIGTAHRRYMHLDEGYIKGLKVQDKPVTLTTTMGSSFLVNTSSIHRARPCREGMRYALTLYLKDF